MVDTFIFPRNWNLRIDKYNEFFDKDHNSVIPKPVFENMIVGIKLYKKIDFVLVYINTIITHNHGDSYV